MAAVFQGLCVLSGVHHLVDIARLHVNGDKLMFKFNDIYAITCSIMYSFDVSVLSVPIFVQMYEVGQIYMPAIT